MTGEVVVVPFPFSDLSSVKNRPALLLLIDLPGPDVVLAAITSTRNSPQAISLERGDSETGRLGHDSFIHPTRLFTFERSQVKRVVGRIAASKRAEVVAKIVSLISQ